MKKILLSAKLDYLLDYAKKQYNKHRGLHLNSKDWESFVNVKTAVFYSFLINGTIKFTTKSKISKESYEQYIKLVNFKKIEPALLLFFLIDTPEDQIINFIKTFLIRGEAKLFCNDPSFCLDADTKIDLLDGKTKTITELCDDYENGIENWVYSVDENGEMKPGKINKVWATGMANKMLKITLDNGESIITTSDHNYILRDGSSIPAQELEIGMSLMPLYFYERNGYKYVRSNNAKDSLDRYKYNSVHQLVAKEIHKDIYEEKTRQLIDTKLEKCLVIHHNDFDKHNNNPDNLIVMGKDEHWIYHAKLIGDNRINVFKGHEKWRKENPDRFKEICSNRGKAYIKYHYNDLLQDFIKAGIEWNRSDEGREFNSTRMKKQWNDPSIRQKMIDNRKFTDEWRQNRSDRFIDNVLSQKTIAQGTKNLIEHNKHNSELNKSEDHRILVEVGNILNIAKRVILEYKYLSDELYETERIKKQNGRKYHKWFTDINDVEYWCKYLKMEKLTKKQYKERKHKLLEYIKNSRKYNHKIVNIEVLDYGEYRPVYDISVENYHNFYTNAGVILHNCYWGSKFNLTKIGSCYGPGETRPPDIRDPSRNFLVCKHLWLVLINFEKHIDEFARGLLPYYKRSFGLTSPTGLERLKKNLGDKGLKKVIESAITNINKLKTLKVKNLFRELTENKLNARIQEKLNKIDMLKDAKSTQEKQDNYVAEEATPEKENIPTLEEELNEDVDDKELNDTEKTEEDQEDLENENKEEELL